VAYDTLSGAWKKQLSFADFEHGYSNIQSVRCTVVDSKTVARGKITIKVEIEVLENGNSRKFAGAYETEHGEDGWKLTSGSIKESK